MIKTYAALVDAYPAPFSRGEAFFSARASPPAFI